MRITPEFIFKHVTPKGSWTYAQIRALGEPTPPKYGWIERACQRDLTQEQIDAFVAAKSTYAPYTLKLRRKEERRRMRAQIAGSDATMAAERDRLQHVTATP